MAARDADKIEAAFQAWMQIAPSVEWRNVARVEAQDGDTELLAREVWRDACEWMRAEAVKALPEAISRPCDEWDQGFNGCLLSARFKLNRIATPRPSAQSEEEA